MSLTLILAQDYLTWKHPNTILSGQIDLSISGSSLPVYLSHQRYGRSATPPTSAILLPSSLGSRSRLLHNFPSATRGRRRDAVLWCVHTPDRRIDRKSTLLNSSHANI